MCCDSWGRKESDTIERLNGNDEAETDSQAERTDLSLPREWGEEGLRARAYQMQSLPSGSFKIPLGQKI